MTEQEAREFLVSVGFVPGVHNTMGRTGPVVAKVKRACRVLRDAELERTREAARKRAAAFDAGELPHRPHRAPWDTEERATVGPPKEAPADERHEGDELESE
jgi:hypothetical protein